MKGPGLRLELDVRRLWRCAECGAERRTSGNRTVVPCHLCKSGKLMSLVEPPRAPRNLPEPLDLLIGLHPDDVDAVPSIPAEPILQFEEPTVGIDTVEEPETSAGSTATEESRGEKRREGRKFRRRSRKDSSSDPPSGSSASDETVSQAENPLKETSVTPESPSATDGFGEGL